MPPEALVECSFLIPNRRDAQISDGDYHDPEDWKWLYQQLVDRFSSWTKAPGLFQGVWKNPETGQRISDRSKKLIVAVSFEDLPRVRHFLAEVCGVFHQKCLYLSVAGQVEFVEEAK